MKIEDQLTRGERIRLEALAQTQALIHYISIEKPTLQSTLSTAELIEKWLKQAREDA